MQKEGKMKRLSIMMVVCGLLVAGGVEGARIGVVNMERLIQMHPRTARDREILDRYIRDFDVERDERLESLRKMSEAFEQIRQQAEDIGLTPDALRERRQQAQLKLEELRQAETALRDLAIQRQQELTLQERRMRERVVSDIRRVLREVAAERELELILDGGEDSAGGYGAVVYAAEPFEVTNEVVLKLRAAVETPSAE
jgi:Skp family chaperone for outer membrane proteins